MCCVGLGVYVEARSPSLCAGLAPVLCSVICYIHWVRHLHVVIARLGVLWSMFFSIQGLVFSPGCT